VQSAQFASVLFFFTEIAESQLLTHMVHY